MRVPRAQPGADVSRGADGDPGKPVGRPPVLDNLGAVRRFTGDYDGAAAVLAEALGMFRDLGSRAGHDGRQ